MLELKYDVVFLWSHRGSHSYFFEEVSHSLLKAVYQLSHIIQIEISVLVTSSIQSRNVDVDSP